MPAKSQKFNAQTAFPKSGPFDILVEKRVTVGHVIEGEGDLSPVEAAMALIGRDMMDSMTMDVTSQISEYSFKLPGLTINLTTDIREEPS